MMWIREREVFGSMDSIAFLVEERVNKVVDFIGDSWSLLGFLGRCWISLFQILTKKNI